MKSKSFFLFLSLLGFFFYWAPAANTNTTAVNTLILKNKATVSDDLVKIKDVATMDSSMRNRIGDLVIAVSPGLGKTGTLQKQEIYEKLVGNGIQPLTIKGPNSVIVLRKGIIVEPSFFEKMVHQYIVTHSRWKNGVHVEILTSKKIAVPGTGIQWQLTPANGEDFFGNILFKIKALSTVTNEAIYSNWIVAKLKIVQPVAISNRSIQKNEMITESDIRWENREITAFVKDAILDKREIIGQKSGRIIRPNSVITGSLLGKRLLVQRGAIALLVAQLKGIKATSTVKALASGSYGDTVRAMNLRSKKIISAVVTGKNTLEVIVQ